MTKKSATELAAKERTYNAVDELWAGLANALDSVEYVDFFGVDQLVHHVHNGTEQTGAFNPVSTSRCT